MSSPLCLWDSLGFGGSKWIPHGALDEGTHQQVDDGQDDHNSENTRDGSARDPSRPQKIAAPQKNVNVGLFKHPMKTIVLSTRNILKP